MAAPHRRNRNRVLRFRSLPLRSRLAILTAAAVAVAVAACAVSCWFIVRGQLMTQLDQSLQTADSRSAGFIMSRNGCLNEAPQNSLDNPAPPILNKAIMQVYLSDGRTCAIIGDTVLPVTDSDKDTARLASTLDNNEGPGPEIGTSPITVTGSDGTEYRVVTKAFSTKNQTQPKTDYGSRTTYVGVVMVARPLSEVTNPLNTLALILLVVSGIGIVGATAAGLWVARAGLKPVDRLTDTVEHIARTEDLSVRIPVDGEDEIARLSTSFNSMTSRLAASRELQQQLIADAGHELRTPLTSLRTNIELLERSEATGRALPPEDRRALLTSVKAQMTELASLIGDLQELSRPDTTPGGSPLQLVAFHEVAETALSRARLRAQDIKILSQLAPWYVRAEPAALERAIVNLLDNAVKFSPPLSSVEVNLHGGELTVRDHGPGISAEDLPHVFERFWRATASRALPGSGLGLSIVARTVQQAGGTVGLHPAHGGGTIAVMRLPGTPMPPPPAMPTGRPTNGIREMGEIREF
ncbi:sensor histidine kinase [Streptomyces sp. NBC_01262]|uniref:sensor histidine kinase n=1 Tax=Streptomyces sp. NBC_01262 TaxID=2903803 RepID=UPI002E352AF6|nr:HAMP domain-containing sensor histidine kinase [Streptomyces sp. NBC_01262]